MFKMNKNIFFIGIILFVILISGYVWQVTKDTKEGDNIDLQKLNCFNMKMQSNICSINNAYIKNGVTGALNLAEDYGMMVKDEQIEVVIEMDSVSTANSLTDEMLGTLDIEVSIRSGNEIYAWIPVQSLSKLVEKYPSISKIKKPNYVEPG